VLAQGIIPALNVMSLSGLFIHRPVLFWWNDTWISRPKITVADRFFVSRRDSFPSAKARDFISIPDGVSDHFTGVTAQSDPDPDFVGLAENKGP